MTAVSVPAGSCGNFVDRQIRYAREGVEAIQPEGVGVRAWPKTDVRQSRAGAITGGRDRRLNCDYVVCRKCAMLGTDYFGMPYVTLER